MGSISQPTAVPQFLIIGAGSRGNAYAKAVTTSTAGSIAAVCEPNAFKLKEFGQAYVWRNQQPRAGQAFSDWKLFIDWESRRRDGAIQQPSPYQPITGIFICTLDETHASIINAFAPLNLHIMCEKPLALSMSDCLMISKSLAPYPPKVFSIGHVLRYSPHNILLRDLLVNKQIIGEVVSVEHTEPVGWWHFAHSYVRGNWRRATKEGVGSLLTKSCHDIDFLLWLLCSPSKLTGELPHLPSTITSSGNLTTFRTARKPSKAGNATNCTNCAFEPECSYSAKSLYHDQFLKKKKWTGWPVKIVAPEIEDIVKSSGWPAAEEALMEKLKEDYTADTPDEEVAKRSWYGRCVWESDNNVMDDQFVTMTWDEESTTNEQFGRGPKQAVFHMTYPTQAQCDRRGRIYGSKGEISYDSKTISVYTFHDQKTQTHHPSTRDPEVMKSHGGGDWGLAGAFVSAVQAVEGGRMSVADAQREFVGCDLEEVIRSHAVVFAAEDARMQKTVINYRNWWSDAVRATNA